MGVAVGVGVSLPFLPAALFVGEDPPDALPLLVDGDLDWGVLLEHWACSDVEGCVACDVASGEGALQSQQIFQLLC